MAKRKTKQEEWIEELGGNTIIGNPVVSNGKMCYDGSYTRMSIEGECPYHDYNNGSEFE